MILHLLLAAVCSLRSLGGATERSAVVAEVTRRVHLVLNEVTHTLVIIRQTKPFPRSTSELITRVNILGVAEECE